MTGEHLTPEEISARVRELREALSIAPDEIHLRAAEPMPLFRNEGGQAAAAEAVGRMQSIMEDFLRFEAVAGR